VYLYPRIIDVIETGTTVFGFNNSLLVSPELAVSYAQSGIDRFVVTLDYIKGRNKA
jgi:hypothetical protein